MPDAKLTHAGADPWARVSIVIPVYNASRFISECIQSVLDQRYENLEIIAVDDGSSDDSVARIEAFGGSVQLIRQENSGSAVARNAGVAQATGQYIGFVDSDDIWAPNRLHQQVAFLERHREYGVVCGRFEHVGADFKLADAAAVDDSSEPTIDQERSGWVYHSLFETAWYHLDTVLVRSEILEKVRFNPDYRRGQDYDFWLQLAQQTQFARLGQVYAYYRHHSESITHKAYTRNFRAEIMERAIERYGPASPDGTSLSEQRMMAAFHQVWFDFGYEAYRAGWYKLAMKAFLRARQYSPRAFKTYKFMLRSLIGFPLDKSPI